MSRLPRAFLASVAVIAGLVFIVLQDPPFHICDGQIKNFQSKQEAVGDWIKVTKECRAGNTPGACYPAFAYLRRLLGNFRLISAECESALAALSFVAGFEEKPPRAKGLPPEKEKKRYKAKALLQEGMELMARLAYTEKEFHGKADKFNWLRSPDMNLFCRMKDRLLVYYGSQAFSDFENSVLDTLTSDKKLSREEIRKRSLFSEWCGNYR